MTTVLSLTVYQRNYWLWKAVVTIFSDRSIIGDDADQVIKVFHCVEVGAINANLRRS